MGRFFFVELKSFELDGKSLNIRIIEQGKGYLRSIRLGRGVFWLLSMVDKVARLEKSVGFVHKVKNLHSAFLCQRCGILMATFWSLRSSVVEGGGESSSSPKASRSGGWCGFVEVLRYLLSPFISMNHAPPVDVSPLLVPFCAPVD